MLTSCCCLFCRRLIDVQNNAGFTALHFAAWVGCQGALSALLSLDARQGLRSCSANGDWITCPVGSTSLHLAAMKGHLHVAKVLLLDYVGDADYHSAT